MKTLSLRATTAACLGVLLAASAAAQTATSGTATTSGTPSASADAKAADRGGKLARADTAFLKQAAQNGHAEVESSKLALTKAVNTQVKSFAQQMVDDHSKANDELAALASSKGVDLPKEPSMAQKAKMKLLSAADGESFDRRYADSMGVAAHEDTLKLFRKAAAEAADPDVKAFAAKTLPTLEHHLQMAKDLKNVTAKAGDKKPAAEKKS